MIDLFIVAVVVLCCCLGAISGAILQIISIAAVAAGVIATYIFSPAATQAMLRWTDSLPVAKIMAYLGVFFCASVAVRVIGACIYTLVRKAKLKKADRVFGSVIGAVKGFCICAVVVVILTHAGSARAREELERSYLASPVVAAVDYVVGKADDINITDKARELLDSGRNLQGQDKGETP